MVKQIQDEHDDSLEGESELKRVFPPTFLETSVEHDSLILIRALTVASERKTNQVAHQFPLRRRFNVPMAMAAGVVIGVAVTTVIQQIGSITETPRLASVPAVQGDSEIEYVSGGLAEKQKMNQEIRELIRNDRVSEAQQVLETYKKTYY